MEAIHKTLSEYPAWSEVVNSDDGRASRKQMMDTRDNEIPSSTNAVITNDDLLMEILLHLPVIALHFFKFVSKRWLSLITSANFTLRLRQIPNFNPPSGLFFRHSESTLVYDFVPLDIRIPLRTSFTFTSEAGINLKILQSCNGLLLCWSGTKPVKYCIYNPSNYTFKMLPEPHISTVDTTRMVFDPTKSPHYKVVQSIYIHDDDRSFFYIKIQTYSSEIGNWSVCDGRFPFRSFRYFKYGIYWNDAIHWLNRVNKRTFLFKLDIVDHPVLTKIQTPQNLNGKRENDRKLLESRGCLLLLCMDYIQSKQLSVYEMRNGYFEWSVKYFVNLDDIMMPLPETWSILCCIHCIVLGEREEDSFMVIKLHEKLVQYKIVLKTIRELCELGSVTPLGSFEFIASFAGV